MENSDAILAQAPALIARSLERRIHDDVGLRRRILSIGIPILLPDGISLLRGPVIKASDKHHGWIDLTPDNMKTWQDRIRAIRESAEADFAADTSSSSDRLLGPAREWNPTLDILDIGEIAGWIFEREEGGYRLKD
jgi:hypothetical protein